MKQIAMGLWAITMAVGCSKADHAPATTTNDLPDVAAVDSTPTLDSTTPIDSPPPAVDDLAEILEPIRSKNELPALAAAVFSGSTLRAIGAVGVRKLGDPTAVTRDDLFHLGSDTKAMTATLAMLVFAEGKLSLATKLSDAFPAFAATMNAGYRDVTLKMLLSHRGGAPGDVPADVWAEMWKPGASKDQRRVAVQTMLSRAPVNTPGTTYLYSNAGYMMVGAALEEATGVGWEQLITDRLFSPLGMSSCGFGAPATKGKVDQPWGHHLEAGKLTPVPPENGDNPPSLGPAGTVHCSLVDWGKFAALHLAGARGEPTKLLSTAEFTTLHTPWPGGDYALGWIVTHRSWGGGDGLVFTHSGSNTMFFATVWIAPAKNAFMLVATNRGDDPPSGAAVDSVFGPLIDKYLK